MRATPLLLLCVACTARTVAGLDPGEDGSFTQRFAPGERPVDVLFVIDSSASMAEEQHALSLAFPRFVQALDDLGAVSWRIGVTTTDLGDFGHTLPTCQAQGDGGRLRVGDPACGAPADRWIWRDGRDTNAPGGDVETALACLARVGTDGCAFEMPLLSAQRALAADADFARDGAFLAVIVVTDEDDCSVVDDGLMDPNDTTLGPSGSFRCFAWGVACDGAVDPFATGPRSGCRPEGSWLENPGTAGSFLDGHPGGSLLAVITGPTNPVFVTRDDNNQPVLMPSCESSAGRAAPALRLAAAVQGRGKGGLALDLCSGDFTPALDAIGQRIGDGLGTRCLERRPPDPAACSVVADGRPANDFAIVDEDACASGAALEVQGTDVTISCPL